jgi:hypothetical protein
MSVIYFVYHISLPEHHIKEKADTGFILQLDLGLCHRCYLVLYQCCCIQ